MDIRLAVTVFDHPKILELEDRLGGERAFKALLRLWAFAAQYHSDGDLSSMTPRQIAMATRWPPEDAETLVAALRDSGLLDGDRIHDWGEHQPYMAHASDRKAAARSAAGAKWRRHREKASKAKGTHTREEWEALLSICGNKCLRCGATDGLVKDHITPIYQGGSDGIENLQPLCKRCNCSKGAENIDHRPAQWSQQLTAARRHGADTAQTTGEEKRKHLVSAPSPDPDPSPDPSPTPDPDLRAARRAVRAQSVTAPAAPPAKPSSDRGQESLVSASEKPRSKAQAIDRAIAREQERARERGIERLRETASQPLATPALRQMHERAETSRAGFEGLKEIAAKKGLIPAEESPPTVIRDDTPGELPEDFASMTTEKGAAR